MWLVVLVAGDVALWCLLKLGMEPNCTRMCAGASLSSPGSSWRTTACSAPARMTTAGASTAGASRHPRLGKPLLESRASFSPGQGGPGPGRVRWLES